MTCPNTWMMEVRMKKFKNENFEDEESEEDEIFDGDRCVLYENLLNYIIIRKKIYTIEEPECHLQVVDLEDSSIWFTQLTKKELPLANTERVANYLIESYLKILLVSKIYSYLNDEVKDFKVFKLDEATNEWMEIHDIGGRTIFLGIMMGTCHYCEESRVRKNSIYFLTQRDRYLYVFDIKNRSISTADWVLQV